MSYKEILFDYETRSEADIKKVGSIEYAKHHSTEIMCVAWKLDNEPVKIWIPENQPGHNYPDKNYPTEFYGALDNSKILKIAHNAGFEIAITKWVLPRYKIQINTPVVHQYKDTAAKAAACALPRDLSGACLALNLPVQKDLKGHKLMLKHSKPRPQWKKTGEGEKYFDNELERWAIYDYCKTDVEAEYLLNKALPDLSSYEQKVWEQTTNANFRGVKVDIETAQKILKHIRIEIKGLEKRALDICGINITQVKELLSWVNKRGAGLSGLGKDLIKQKLLDNENLSSEVRELLEIRLKASKSSTKKFQSMLTRAGADGRVRDNSIYHGASTGRDAGRGLQLLNLPRGIIKDTNLAIETFNQTEKDHGAEFVSMLYGDTLSVFSSMVRGMIIPTEGFELFMADYASIEARVLAWIAGQEDLLEAFRNNADPYRNMAAKIFGVSLESVTKAQREVGKRAILGCGYGMGFKRFRESGIEFGGVDVGEILAKKAVATYRKSNRKIINAWYNTERAAISAVRKDKAFKINRTAWVKRKGFLWCQLPSGRPLAFYKPFIKNEPSFNGDLRPKLYHWGENPKTHQWGELGLWHGTLMENVVQAVARDIMTHARMNLEAKGYKYLFSVYDEVIFERQIGQGSVEEYEKILTTLPQWAEGLPIKAEAEKDMRYHK